MKKITMLLPKTYNDGTIIPLYKVESALNDLSSLAGGYTLEGECEGLYKMANGQTVREKTFKLFVVIQDSLLEPLKLLAKRFAKYFGQECIYFEISPANVEFIGEK